MLFFGLSSSVDGREHDKVPFIGDWAGVLSLSYECTLCIHLQITQDDSTHVKVQIQPFIEGEYYPVQSYDRPDMIAETSDSLMFGHSMGTVEEVGVYEGIDYTSYELLCCYTVTSSELGMLCECHFYTFYYDANNNLVKIQNNDELWRCFNLVRVDSNIHWFETEDNEFPNDSNNPMNIVLKK